MAAREDKIHVAKITSDFCFTDFTRILEEREA
jgi:hypothetical protein